MAEKRIRRETHPITTTTTTILDLHPDLLHLIVQRLDQKSLQSISLVSPCFIPLSNIFITQLTLHHNYLPDSKFQHIFRRFPSVNEINLKSTTIGRALTAIAHSSLKIDALRIFGDPSYPDKRLIMKLQSSPGKLKDVKRLKVRWFVKRIGFRRMVEFIKIFSGINVLDLTFGRRWDDAGIQLLAQNVPNLQVILLGHNELLTDQSLESLAHYCRDLQHFILEGRSGMTPEGICGFIRRMPNLRSLHLPVFSLVFTQAVLLRLGNAAGSLRYITYLGICDILVNDDVLEAIGSFKLLLTSLVVEKAGTHGLYTMKGLGALLNSSRSLRNLRVILPELDLGNQDRTMSQLVKLLPQLRFIEICTLNWFHETLFSLIENCHKLTNIAIRGDEGKCGSDIHATPPRKKNVSIGYILIGPRLEESLRTTLVSSCPVLKRLETWNLH